MSDDEKLYKDEEVITDITRRHVAGNFAARHWIEKAVRESKEYFSKQARAEVIEEVLGIIEKWKQPRLTALEAQGSHNEIIYVNILKEELTKLREQK